MAQKLETLTSNHYKLRSRHQRLQTQHKCLSIRLRVLSHAQRSDEKLAILSEKLQELGVQPETLLSSVMEQSHLLGASKVTFTFVGPAGLIEGGSNQSFALPIDVQALVSVQQMKGMLTNEIEIDSGIEIQLKHRKVLINTLAKLKQACAAGKITVEFIEVADVAQTSAIDSDFSKNFVSKPPPTEERPVPETAGQEVGTLEVA